VKRKLIQLVGSVFSIKRQGIRWSVCLIALVLAGVVPSFAKTLTVTNTDDSGPGSLRDAIATADPGDRIEFSVTGTITLSSGSLTLDKNLTIKGPGAAQLAISGGGNSVLVINSGVISISDLSIQHGEVRTPPYLGAGILNHGTLTLTESTVSDNDNEAGSGGGIYNDGTLTLVGSTISKNYTFYSGGGIANSGSLTLINTTVSGNATAEGNGGGIVNGGALTLINSTVSGNFSFNGGGIYNSGTLTAASSAVSGNGTQIDGAGGGVYNQGGTVTVTDSTFAGNSALTVTGGGGIYNDDGTFTVTSSTIAENSSGYQGGGIFNNDGTFTVTNSTIADNSTGRQGGGIYNVGTFTIKSSLVVNNGAAGNCDSSGGTATSLGYNISDDDTCTSSFTAIGDENNVIPGAGLDTKGLQNNGGPTQTIALLPGSPAVDHIPVADCTDTNGNPVKTDQRGIKRPQGPACDVGAFELVETVPFSNFTALLAIQTGHNPGFGLTARFTLGSGGDSFAPLTQPVTLQIANYTVDIPAGSFPQLWNSPSTPYIYDGTINGTKLVVGVIPLGGKSYEFNAAGSPVAWTNVTNPVTVSLTAGNDGGGSTPVRAFIDKH
jgi:hypothetical protein